MQSAADLAREKRLKKFEDENSAASPVVQVEKVSPSISSPTVPKPPSMTSPAASISPPNSGMTPQRKKLYLNSSLQQCLHITLKKEEARADIKYLACLEEEMGGQDMEEEMIDRYVYEALSSSIHEQHPFTYLMNAHSRCDKESRSGREFLRNAAAVATEQVSRHAALLLTVPDFVEGADGSVDLLADALLSGGPTYAERTFFLQNVLACVADQGTDAVDSVVSPLVDKVLAVWRTKPNNIINDNSLNALKVLITIMAFKPAVNSFVSRSDFFLPPATANDVPQAMSFFFNQPAKHSGPALEMNTPLGLALRVYVDLMNPTVVQLFSNPARLTLHDKTSSMSMLRSPLTSLHTQQATLVTNLLKGGAEGKNKTIAWLCEALEVNASANASNPDPMKVSSLGTRFNLTSLLLNLSMPFVGDSGKESKIVKDSTFLWNQSGGAFPSDLPLLQSPEATVAQPNNDGDVNFISQCFFLTWRSLNLSIVQQLDDYENQIRRLSFFHHRLVAQGADPNVDPQLNQFHQRLLLTEVSLFDPALLENTLKFVGTAARWLISRIEDPNMPSLPSHFLDDILLVVIGISKRCPDALTSGNNPGKGTASPLSSLFDCVVGFLGKPELVHSPHLLARIGELLYEVYLENSEKPNSHRNVVGPHNQLLRTHPRAVTDLAPALLALYGSVEHISEEEKVNCRIHCARLLKFLWGASNAHRVTFRRISADHSTFIKFANGLMNETNAYVAQIMEKLPEVRAMQLLMADGTQWGALEQSERDEKLQRHSDNERSLRGFLPLCNETIHTVAYLSSDEEIRGPFLLPALLDRVSSMLLSVLVQLVGAKGLEIKINDPESYDFHPKQMLKEICETVVNFSSSAKFQEAVSRSGYYSTHPSVLPKALNTARKLRILSQEALDALNNLCEAAAKFKASTNAEEEDGVDIPERFVDPLLYTLMSDPVKLPMGTVMDRVTIEQHLLNDPMDPFSRQPLTVDQLVPDTALREEIEAWKAARSSSK